MPPKSTALKQGDKQLPKINGASGGKARNSPNSSSIPKTEKLPQIKSSPSSSSSGGGGKAKSAGDDAQIELDAKIEAAKKLDAEAEAAKKLADEERAKVLAEEIERKIKGNGRQSAPIIFFIFCPLLITNVEIGSVQLVYERYDGTYYNHLYLYPLDRP